MPFDPRQLLHLIGESPDPDGVPEKVVLDDPLRILGTGGIRVFSSEDDTLISLDDELRQRIEDSLPPAPTIDNLSGMDFRCTWGDDAVNVHIGHVGYVSWAAPDWISQQYEVAAETKALPGSYPFGVYLKIPIKKVLVNTNDGTGPYASYISPPSTIDGTDYAFTVEYSTSHTIIDLAGPPATFYSARTTPPTASPLLYQPLIANVTAEGSVAQVSFGNINLPQVFWPNLRSLVVAVA